MQYPPETQLTPALRILDGNPLGYTYNELAMKLSQHLPEYERKAGRTVGIPTARQVVDELAARGLVVLLRPTRKRPAHVARTVPRPLRSLAGASQ